MYLPEADCATITTSVSESAIGVERVRIGAVTEKEPSSSTADHPRGVCTTASPTPLLRTGKTLVCP